MTDKRLHPSDPPFPSYKVGIMTRPTSKVVLEVQVVVRLAFKQFLAHSELSRDVHLCLETSAYRIRSGLQVLPPTAWGRAPC